MIIINVPSAMDSSALQEIVPLWLEKIFIGHADIADERKPRTEKM